MINVNKEESKEITDELIKKGFSAKQSGGGEGETSHIMMIINTTLKVILDKLGIETVPEAHGGNETGSFYDLVMKNYEFMLNGHAEGIVINQRKNSNWGGEDFITVCMTKWKIGSERNYVNVDFLDKMIKMLETEGDEIFGENVEKAKDMFQKMLNICHS